MISALFVETNGCYFGLPNVDPWDEARDARLYAGPHPVVAHPPCARWSRLANVTKARYGTPIGADDGCFESALASVRKYGGVLEHPAQSMAFRAFNIPTPLPLIRGWVSIGNSEYICTVAQSAYGHQAQKLTWLLYNSVKPPGGLNWDRPRGTHTIAGDGKHPRLLGMKKKDRIKTPEAFRDLLISLAENSR